MRGTSKAPSARSKSKTLKRLRTRFGVPVALIAVLVLALPAGASADPLGSNTEFSTLPESTGPLTLVEGSDGNVWFTDSNPPLFENKKIGKVTPAGEVTMYTPGLSGYAWGIADGPDGNVWFTEPGAKKVGHVKPSEPATSLVEIEVPGMPAAPEYKSLIATGPDGNLWVSLETGGIARITPAGTVTEFTAGLNAGAKVCSIAAGPDGNVWFGDCGTTRAVGSITPTGTIAEYSVAGAFGNQPNSVAFGSDGRLWFPANNSASERLGAITTAGVVTYYKTPTVPVAVSLNSLTAGPDGNVWARETSQENELQKATLTATGGTYKLGFEGKETGATGSGDLSGGSATGDLKRVTGGSCKRTSGSKELKGCTSIGSYEAGMRISGSGIPLETVIEKIEGTTIFISNAVTGAVTEVATALTAGWIVNVSVSSGELKVGQEITGTSINANSKILALGEKEGKPRITLTSVPTAEESGVALSFGSKTVANVATSSGAFVVGEVLSGTGIAANTTITAVGSETLTISNLPTASGTSVVLSANLPFGAGSSLVKEALQALSTIGAKNVSVSASAIENGQQKTGVSFTGKFERTDVPLMTCDGSKLTGTEPGCTVATTSEALQNRLFRITPTGKLTEFKLKPATYLYPFTNANALAVGPGGNVWYTSNGTPLAVGKFGTECVESCPTPNKRTLTLSKSPDPSTGAGTGTVTSKAKGINCASACTEAVGRFYKNSSVILTEKPYGETSAFKEWNNVGDPGGACDGSTLASCTVSMTEDQEIEAVFKGTSKAILSPTALTVSKGESEEARGYGTVKAAGLVCESECDETTVLYQGKVTSPKVIAAKTVELKALAAFGSKFTGWSGGGCSGTEPTCKVTMNEATTVKAEFEAVPNQALTVEKAYEGGLGTVSSKAKGINCAATCTQAVADMPEGASILLTAKPAKTEPATTFVEWEGGDCDEVKVTTCTVTMDEAETVKALFSGPVKAIVEPQKLTLAKAGSGYGTVKAAGLACEALCTTATSLYYGPVTEPKEKAGAKVILKAAPAPGSKAVEWTGCESNPTPSECVVVMSEAKNVTAKFDELE